MTQPFMDGKTWGLPYNRTPDRDTFGGQAPARRSAGGPDSNRAAAWRAIVVGATIAAIMALVLLTGTLAVAAQRPSDTGRVQPGLRSDAIAGGQVPTLDFTDRLLDTNGPENRGR